MASAQKPGIDSLNSEVHARTVQPAAPRMRGIARRLLRNFRDYGLRITCGKSLAYLLRGVYFHQVYRLYRINLNRIAPAVPSHSTQFTFRLLSPQDSGLIAQVENIAEWLHGQMKSRIEAGQLCLVAMDGAKIAGFNLINLREASMVLVNRRVPLRAGSAWSEHIAVLKEYRRSGLGADLRRSVFEVLRSRGIRRLYGGTLRSNIAALKLTRAVGFKEIGDLHYKKVLSFEEWRFRRIRV
jgi:GNAT superfamily N-acetyltransferase